MALTFEQLILKVLEETKKAISADEIWEIALQKGYDKELGSRGKTPVATLSALIYRDINENKEESPFVKASYRPTLFYLREYDNIIDKSTFRENPKFKEGKEDEESPIKSLKSNIEKSGYNEKDLHSHLVYYASLYLNCYCKTINHSTSAKKEFGEWQHPDIVGCKFPTEEWKNPEVFKLSASVGNISLQVFSFELKKKLSFENLREAFFQAVSNSSWSNEGYLVAPEIIENPEFLNELKRLSSSFGIGVIKLDLKEPDSSYVLFPSRVRETLDWETINKLFNMNSDFQEFIKRVNKDFERKEIIFERYDKILSKEELLKIISK